MTSLPNRALAAVAVFALTATNVVQQTEAHPNCIGDFAPDLSGDSGFCPNEYDDGFCCSGAQEVGIEVDYDAAVAAGATGRCAEMYQEVICGVCHPWSGHLYERLGTALTLTNDFCNEFYAECSGLLGLAADYCDVHTGGDGNQYYSYPLVIDDTFSGENLVKAFPDISDSDLPTNPIDMRMTPDGSKWWVLGLNGQIVEIDVEDPTSTTPVMDISGSIRLTFEEGLLSFAFSPGFHNTGVFYVCYVMTVSGDEYGSNRLSKFSWNGSSVGSEEVLITSSMKSSEVHSAGWIGFKPSAYGSDSAGASNELYWAMGDGGPQEDTTNNGQNTNTLHGSIMRISVDSQMDSSYSVPGSNPYSGGGGRGEICAQGFRNPYKCSFDSDNDDLYCGDVGHLRVESVKTVECGNNYGWRRFEGERCMEEVESEFPDSCADVDRGPYTPPIFNYCHPDYYPVDEADYLVPNDNFCGDRSVIGNAVIGGFVYRGVKYADLLYGNYVFADYQYKRLYNLFPNGSGYGYNTVVNDDFLQTSSFAESNDGELFLIQYKGSIYEMPCGDICDGENVNPDGLPEPPPPLTPSPVTVAPVTVAPTSAETIAPTTAAPVDAETVAPSTAAPSTAAPVDTAAPTTAAPLPAGETAAPVTPSPTASPTVVVEEPATPAPSAAPSAAPEVITPSPMATVTPSPVNGETPAPTKVAEPTTEPPIFARTHAPMGTPEPTSPRTASPERLDDDYDRAPVRTATSPPEEMPVEAGTPAPVVPVPVTPEVPEPGTPEVPAPTAEPREPTAVPEPTVPAPTPVGGFVCDGHLSPLEQYCCPSECGECGGVGCSSRPGGQDACCTSSITDLCAVTGVAPCHIPPGDDSAPSPVPAPGAPEVPSTPETPEGLEPGTEPLIPGEPNVNPPVSSDDLARCSIEYGEDVVPMSGPEESEVSPPDYLGCFIDSPGDRILALSYNATDAMTPTVCETFCRGEGADMFGLQLGRQCFCGDSRDSDVEKHGRTECNTACSGDDTVTCGGHDRADVYYMGGGPKVPVDSAYLGCYADAKEERALGERFLWCDGTMTVPLCEQFCRSKDAVVYGVQYGHECWCGDHFDHDMYGHGVCNYRCVGDRHTTCGGFDAQNVYSLHY